MTARAASYVLLHGRKCQAEPENRPNPPTKAVALPSVTRGQPGFAAS